MMHLPALLMVATCVLLTGCKPLSGVVEPLPAATQTIAALAQLITGVPTANPIASRTPTIPPTFTATQTFTATYTPTLTPTLTLTPSVTPSLTPTLTLTATLAASSTPIASATWTPPGNDPNYTPPPSWTPPPANPNAQLADHYWFGRVIPSHAQDWVARTYPYGNTSGGRLQVHHGVDLVNPRGTQILAASGGTVLYAGDDLTTRFGPINNYYGNLVVIQHPQTTTDGLPVFTLYGHMDRVVVGAGQAVGAGETIGYVGGTGVALGPHLHFEVRVGDAYDFGATRNPELWIRPYPTFGTLAGRVTDASGALLYDVTIQVESDDISRYAFSYADTTVNPDSVFGENLVLGDLPADYYEVLVAENGRARFRQIVYIYANRTTWLEIQLSP